MPRAQTIATASAIPLASVPESPVPRTGAAIVPGTASPAASETSPLTSQEQAEEALRRQERQRIAGVVPNFNVSYDANAVPLSRKQKLRLAFRSAVDPVAFGFAGFDASISQAENDYPGYGQGMKGFAKRFGAAYADNFDGTMLGNAIFPALLKQDPRYFRRGTGSFTARLLYAVSTTVWCKNDNGTHGPNYSNVLGNLAAGGISNLYYPASDRGAGLTLQRGFTVTAYGAFGGVFNEFWPDLARRLFKDHMVSFQANVPPAPPVPVAAR